MRTSQFVFLENIAYGKKDATMEEIRQAIDEGNYQEYKKRKIAGMLKKEA